MNEEYTRDDYAKEIMKLQKRLKRKNPNDATFRNINAIKRRLDRIEKLLAIKTGRKAK